MQRVVWLIFLPFQRAFCNRAPNGVVFDCTRFDELKDHRSGMVIIAEFSRDIHFCFHCFKEAFSRCIVPAVPLSAHALGDVRILVQQVGKRFTGILNATIRMEQQLVGNRSFCTSLVKRGHTGVSCTQVSRQRPPYGLAIPQIHDRGQIDPALLGGQIGDVTHPDFPDTVRSKPTVQQVRGYRTAVFGVGRSNPLASDPAGNVHRPHQPCNPRTTDPAVLTYQFPVDPRGAIGSARTVPDLKDLSTKAVVLYRARTHRSVSPAVIPTTADSEYLGHLLNGIQVLMISHKLIDYPFFLEKMPMAFFRISRSMRRSAFSCLMRSSSFCSSLKRTVPCHGKLLSSPFSYSLRHR